MQEKPVIIDVRTSMEYLISHIPGAVLIPYDGIRHRIEEIVPNKSTQIALYCRSGHRSGIANQVLQEMGYINSENYGGYTEAKYKLESEKVI